MAEQGNIEIARSTSFHTPTPWEVSARNPHRILGPIGPKNDESLGPDYYADMAIVEPGQGGTSYSPAMAIANAAFIVRAVNAHDELVKALRDMLAMVERHGVWGNGPNGQPIASGGGPKETTIGNIICDFARAALADLEGN